MMKFEELHFQDIYPEGRRALVLFPNGVVLRVQQHKNGQYLNSFSDWPNNNDPQGTFQIELLEVSDIWSTLQKIGEPVIRPSQELLRALGLGYGNKNSLAGNINAPQLELVMKETAALADRKRGFSIPEIANFLIKDSNGVVQIGGESISQPSLKDKVGLKSLFSIVARIAGFLGHPTRWLRTAPTTPSTPRPR